MDDNTRDMTIPRPPPRLAVTVVAVRLRETWTARVGLSNWHHELIVHQGSTLSEAAARELFPVLSGVAYDPPRQQPHDA